MLLVTVKCMHCVCTLLVTVDMLSLQYQSPGRPLNTATVEGGGIHVAYLCDVAVLAS